MLAQIVVALGFSGNLPAGSFLHIRVKNWFTLAGARREPILPAGFGPLGRLVPDKQGGSGPRSIAVKPRLQVRREGASPPFLQADDLDGPNLPRARPDVHAPCARVRGQTLAPGLVRLDAAASVVGRLPL
jgi:hypothetical protein